MVRGRRAEVMAPSETPARFLASSRHMQQVAKCLRSRKPPKLQSVVIQKQQLSSAHRPARARRRRGGRVTSTVDGLGITISCKATRR